MKCESHVDRREREAGDPPSWSGLRPGARRGLVWLGLALLMFSGGTFAAEDDRNLWQLHKHMEADGTFTITAAMLDKNNPPAVYQEHAINGTYDDGYGLDSTPPAKLILNTGRHEPVGTQYTAGYYRGVIYTAPAAGAPFTDSERKGTNQVSVFSTRDHSDIIVAVDQGPVFTTTNSGLRWKMITAPGLYQFPLCVGSDGGGLYAQVTVDQTLSARGFAGRTNAFPVEWYAVATASDGSKLVAAQSAGQPAPTLNIRYSRSGVTLAWSAQFTNFTLEQSAGLGGDAWTVVTNSVKVEGEENQVVVPPAAANDFFRLRNP